MPWSLSDLKNQIDAIESVIAGRITSDLQDYSIAGRRITKIPINELLVLRDKLKAEYNRELAAENIKLGLGNPNTIKTRF